MTRQRLQQLKHKERGLCETCSNPSPHKARCDRCAALAGVRKRHPTPADWEKVDWHQPNKVIADLLNVTPTCVSHARRRFNKTKKDLWAEVDWSKSDLEIAEQMQVAVTWAANKRYAR